MRTMSFTELLELPESHLILLSGAPGAGKSTFCRHMVLTSLAMGRPVIFVTTERSPSAITTLLREEGLGGVSEKLLFVDAFAETVGRAAREQPGTIAANCENLNSISVAIAKQQQKINEQNIHLFFDSLTSPYMFNKEEIFRFLRFTLLRFAAEGNSVVALVDEECGNKEDFVAMMSVADGIIKMEAEDGSRILHVVKHPSVKPKRIEFSAEQGTALPFQTMDAYVTRQRQAAKSGFETSFRSEVGDFVNIFWGSFTFWSGMLWDPQRFPAMLYNLHKEIVYEGTKLYMEKLPFHIRVLHRFMPKGALLSPGYVEKRVFPVMAKPFEKGGEAITEYLREKSKPAEYYIRMHEGARCWGLENVGVPLCYDDAGYIAAMTKFFDKEERDWNAVEIECMGKGSPYCEFKVIPGESDELQEYLKAMDGPAIERITERLMEHATAYILQRKPLGERPTLGKEAHMLMFVQMPALVSGRYRMALQMGGAVAGKRLAEHLLAAGLREDEVIERVIDFANYCKAGKITVGETIRMKENCETFGLRSNEPMCYFTTGFLNGLFSTVKNQHVKEKKCIAVGDMYCEWEVT